MGIEHLGVSRVPPIQHSTIHFRLSTRCNTTVFTSDMNKLPVPPTVALPFRGAVAATFQIFLLVAVFLQPVEQVVYRVLLVSGKWAGEAVRPLTWVL